MKAYQVLNYNHNLLTNTFDIVTQFALGNRPLKTVHLSFNTKQDAEAYLLGDKRTWLIGCIEDYINHKKHIIEAGNGTEEQKKALTACLNFYNDIYTKALAIETICTRFIKGKAYFNAILPNQNNSSYASSLNNLTELINFCEQHLKIVQ